VTGPKAVAVAVCDLTGVEMSDELVREAAVRLSAECAGDRAAVEQALRELLNNLVNVALMP